jgi:hypothetical protein
MITSNKTMQLGAGYENSCTNASNLELLVCYQIIQRALANREKFSCLLATDEQFVISGQPGFSWAFLGWGNHTIHLLISMSTSVSGLVFADSGTICSAQPSTRPFLPIQPSVQLGGAEAPHFANMGAVDLTTSSQLLKRLVMNV